MGAAATGAVDGPGETYTAPRHAIINAPPPMGTLGGLSWGTPGRRSANTQGGYNTQGGFDTQP